jgi:EmrB/QacA subfamily drug resistance transporter
MTSRSRFAILSGVMLAMLLASLDQTIVSTAMPTIVEELHGLEHISWVFTAYMLGSTVCVPIYGKLSDIFGRKKLYLIGIIIFLGGSVLCGLSQGMNQLIAFRGLQGIGGGAMMVNSFAIIGEVFPPAERGKYQGIMGGVFGLSSIAGPLLGGWITDTTSWRWVFYVNIPLGIIAIVVLSSTLPKIVAHARNKSIDWWGGLFILTSLVPLLLSLVWGGSLYAWTSWPILVALIVSGISIIIFIRIEKRAINPILSLDLFRNRVFIVSVLALFLTSMGMFGAILYVPIFSQGVIGVSATHAGLILTPLMLSLVVTSALSGQMISRTGKYKWVAVTGTAIIMAGLFYFSTVDTGTISRELTMRMIVLGIGLGATMPVFTLAVQNAFPKTRLGEVTAGTQLFRNIGGTVGTAVLGGIMNARLSKEIAGLKDEPFVVTMSQMPVVKGVQHSGGSLIQEVLNPSAQQAIRASLQHSPQNSVSALADFDKFIVSSKQAFSSAVDQVFIVAAILMAVALINVLFLPEIPLRKSDKPALETEGMVLQDEFGQRDKG